MSNNNKHTMSISDIDKFDLDISDKGILELADLKIYGMGLPEGFIIMPYAYQDFLALNNLHGKISDLISTIHFERPESVMQVSHHIKNLLHKANLPIQLENDIYERYRKITDKSNYDDVTVGKSHKAISGYMNIIHEVKNIWVSQFAPKHLINADTKKIDVLHDHFPILIKKVIESKKSGRLHTKDLNIETEAKLNKEELEELTSIGRKLKSNYLIPQVVEWVLYKNKFYATAIKPLT